LQETCLGQRRIKANNEKYIAGLLPGSLHGSHSSQILLPQPEQKVETWVVLARLFSGKPILFVPAVGQSRADRQKRGRKGKSKIKKG